jgi:hypothetical protein
MIPAPAVKVVAFPTGDHFFDIEISYAPEFVHLVRGVDVDPDPYAYESFPALGDVWTGEELDDATWAAVEAAYNKKMNELVQSAEDRYCNPDALEPWEIDVWRS